MNIKRILAGGIAAITAGATLAFGAMAASASLGDYVQVSGNALASPLVVVGNTGGSDVLGAADIAAALAGYATTTTSVAGCAVGCGEVSVEGGVRTDSSSVRFWLGDNINKGGTRNTLTSADLEELATETFSDDTGSTFKYDQYLNLGSVAIQFANSGGDLTDGEHLINIGSTGAAPAINYTIVFQKALNFSSSNTHGNRITLKGRAWTISASSDTTLGAGSNKIVLLGGATGDTSVTEDEQTFNINGVDYKIQVTDTTSGGTAGAGQILVNSESKSVTAGNTYQWGDLSLYVSYVKHPTIAGQTRGMTVQLGADKLTITDNAALKTGVSDTVLQGTLASITVTSGEVSQFVISWAGKDSSNDYTKSGKSLELAPFGNFLAFNDMSQCTACEFSVDNEGTTGANLKFKDDLGKDRSITWLKTGTSSFAATLNDTTSSQYIVQEGANWTINDVGVLAEETASGADGPSFTRLLKLTSITSRGSSGAQASFNCVSNCEGTTTVSLSSGSYTTGTLYIGGQSHYIYTNSNQNLNIYTGGGASTTGVGNAYTVFPELRANNGCYWLAFAKNTTIVNTSTGAVNYTVLLPTGNVTVQLNNTFNGTAVHRVDAVFDSNAALLKAGVFASSAWSAEAVNVGRAQYSFRGVATGFEISPYYGGSSVNLLFKHKKAKDTTETDQRNLVVVYAADGSGSGVDTTIQVPNLTDATQYSVTRNSDSSITDYATRGGAYVTHDTDGQGLTTTTIYDLQPYAVFAVGSNPTFSSTTTGGSTVNTAVKITSPVAKFASEVNTASLAADLVLVGGPCANSLVASLAADTANGIPTCDGWNLQEGLIKEIENAWGSGKKALVVAGTNAADTRNLAAKVMQGTLSYSA